MEHWRMDDSRPMDWLFWQEAVQIVDYSQNVYSPQVCSVLPPGFSHAPPKILKTPFPEITFDSSIAANEAPLKVCQEERPDRLTSKTVIDTETIFFNF